MKCEKRLKMKIALNIVLFIIGVCAIAVSIHLNANNSGDAFTASYLGGTGTGLTVITIIMIIKKMRILKNEQKLKEFKIESEDERNLLLAYKASHYSLVLTAVGAYIALLICVFFNKTIAQVLSIFVCIPILARFVLYHVFRKSV